MTSSGKKDVPVILFGTPLADVDEDQDDKHYSGELKQKKDAAREAEQYVLDDQGRRRFHGAFTGGFSAGYFNTVGTKEGWTPKNFVSSRKDRLAENSEQQQHPEDFMDKEDLEQFGIAPRKVTTSSSFEEKGETSTSNELIKLVVADRLSKGENILMRMGWRPGTGIGVRIASVSAKEEHGKMQGGKKKVFGCALPPDLDDGESRDDKEDIRPVWGLAPYDIEVMSFTPKSDYHCIGYNESLKNVSDQAQVKKSDGKGIFEGERGHINLFGDIPLLGEVKKKSKSLLNRKDDRNKLGMKGSAFGVGALEEEDEMEDNPYDDDARELQQKYDFSMIELPDSAVKRKPQLAITQPGNDRLKVGGFERAKKKLASSICYAMPKVPIGWRPKKSHIVVEKQAESKPAKRSRPSRFSDLQQQDNTGDSKIPRLGNAEKPRDSAPKAKLAKSLPAKTQPLAQALSESFKNRFTSAEKPDLIIGEEKMARKAEPKIEEAKPEASEKIVRTSYPWMPERVLCKRFNVKFAASADS